MGLVSLVGLGTLGNLKQRDSRKVALSLTLAGLLGCGLPRKPNLSQLILLALTPPLFTLIYTFYFSCPLQISTTFMIFILYFSISKKIKINDLHWLGLLPMSNLQSF